MDKDFMLNYFNKAVQPEWEELLKTPRYQLAASKRDAIEREFFRMLNDEQKRKYLDLESAVILAECDIAEAMYMKGAADREMMIDLFASVAQDDHMVLPTVSIAGSFQRQKAHQKS